MTKKDMGKTSENNVKEKNADTQKDVKSNVNNNSGTQNKDRTDDKSSESKQGKTAKSSTKSDTKKKTTRRKPTTAKTDSLKEKIHEAEKQAAEWQDKYMRLSAEFDNYRKRTLKEKVELTKTANANLLVNMLPVIDDFERGFETIDKASDIEAMKEGMNHVYKKLQEFIKQNGIKEIEAKEKEFNIDYHEALTKIPAPSDELKGKVVDVIEKGYLLNDKVIRYAKVVVGE